MGLFGRDLHRAANSGRPVVLKDGTEVVIRAMSWRAVERLEQELPGWFDRLLARIEQMPAGVPDGSELGKLWRDLSPLRSEAKEFVVFILADSNPEMRIDLEWARDHVSPTGDIPRLVNEWIAENELQHLVEHAKKKLQPMMEAFAPAVGSLAMLWSHSPSDSDGTSIPS